jgi:ActR/RegA family two-component response regulator
MSRGHHALILEDDEAAAKALIDAIRARGDEASWARTRAEARRLLAQHTPCYVIPDIEVPNDDGDIPNEAAGLTFIKHDVRAAFRGRDVAGDKHLLQIIAVTGFSTAPSFVELVMQEGASAFIAKPLPGNLEIVRKIDDALRHSRRLDHADCERITREARGSRPPLASSPETVRHRIAIDGAQSKGRTMVRADGSASVLQDSLFVLLLRLIEAHLRRPGSWHHRDSLGGHAERKWELPSRLNVALRRATEASDLVVAESDKHGSYRFNPEIAIEHIDLAALGRHSDRAVRTLGEGLGKLWRVAGT